MNGKKMLLIGTLVCALGAVALAQGLVGAPVDPRYGQGDSAPARTSNAKTAGNQPQSAAGKIADAVLALLLATRL